MKSITVKPEHSKLRQLAIKAKTNHGYKLSQDMIAEIEAIELAEKEETINFFCWHKWSKWGDVTPAYSNNAQHKTCVKCNAIRWRKVGISIYTGAATAINDQIEKIKKELS